MPSYHPTICTCNGCLPCDCPDCDRNFRNLDELFKHLTEEKHTGTYCGYCARQFDIRSALTQHYESDGCWKFGRHKIKDLVRRSGNGGHVLNDSISEAPPRELATEASFIPEIGLYKCSLCPSNKKGFKDLKDLNQHLHSPKHDAPKYRCTNKNCHSTFTTLGSVHQHTETMCCLSVFEKEMVMTVMVPEARRPLAVEVRLESASGRTTKLKMDPLYGMRIYQEPEVREEVRYQVSGRLDQLYDSEERFTDDEEEEVSQSGLLGIIGGVFIWVFRLLYRLFVLLVQLVFGVVVFGVLIAILADLVSKSGGVTVQ